MMAWKSLIIGFGDLSNLFLCLTKKTISAQFRIDIQGPYQIRGNVPIHDSITCQYEQ